MEKAVSDILKHTGENLRTGQEIAAASATVMQKRLEIMAGAAADPMRADHAELNRMGTEKVEALMASANAATEASVAFGETCQDIAQRQAELLRANMETLSNEANEASRLALQTEQIAQFWGQAIVDGMSLWAKGLDAQARIMAPVHATVTANAERLKK